MPILLFCLSVLFMQRWICLLRWWRASSWTGSFRVWRAKRVSNTFSFVTPQPPPSSSLSVSANNLRLSIIFIYSLMYLFISQACSSVLRGRPHLDVPECTTAKEAAGGAAACTLWCGSVQANVDLLRVSIHNTPGFSHRPFLHPVHVLFLMHSILFLHVCLVGRKS